MLWRRSCSVERNHLCYFERGHHGQHLCEVILNLDQLFRRRCRLKKKFMKDGRMKAHHNTLPFAFGSGELKINRRPVYISKMTCRAYMYLLYCFCLAESQCGGQWSYTQKLCLLWFWNMSRTYPRQYDVQSKVSVVLLSRHIYCLHVWWYGCYIFQFLILVYNQDMSRWAWAF